MRTTNAVITIAAGILLSACGKQEAPAADTTKPAAATRLGIGHGEQARRNAQHEDS